MNATISPGMSTSENCVTREEISASNRPLVTGILMVLIGDSSGVVQYWMSTESGTLSPLKVPDIRVVRSFSGEQERSAAPSAKTATIVLFMAHPVYLQESHFP